jgi:hypothetical protein
MLAAAHWFSSMEKPGMEFKKIKGRTRSAVEQIAAVGMASRNDKRSQKAQGRE